jgi:hypothetical protein
MYPTGGYGNFLYCLLNEHLDSTVKLNHRDWAFEYGNSHSYPKYTESFLLGKATWYGTLKSFSYNYGVLNTEAAEQISQDKKFVVLADVGNKGDNVKFLRRYFPNSKIVRVYAETFVEKLILWTNCMTKSAAQTRNGLYPGSILTSEGIATWANKPIDSITDLDAVNCMVNFFQEDFGIYGKMFSKPVANAVNIPIRSFFSANSIHQTVEYIASELDTQCTEQVKLTQLANEFINQQLPLLLLTPGDSFPLVREALIKYGHKY